jgi:hypothetical protein
MYSDPTWLWAIKTVPLWLWILLVLMIASHLIDIFRRRR